MLDDTSVASDNHLVEKKFGARGLRGSYRRRSRGEAANKKQALIRKMRREDKNAINNENTQAVAPGCKRAVSSAVSCFFRQR